MILMKQLIELRNTSELINYEEIIIYRNNKTLL